MFQPAAGGACEPCPAGSYCPEGSSAATLCPAGQFQQQRQQSACVDCPENYDCGRQGTAQLSACPAGRTSPAGSPAGCGDCDYEKYYYHAGTKTCTPRTVICNPSTQYEVFNASSKTQERACRALTVCKTVRLKERSPIYGGP